MASAAKLTVGTRRSRSRRAGDGPTDAMAAADEPSERRAVLGKALNATNLEALGAARLAELLMAVSEGNAAAQRQLRLALAGSGGAHGMAQAVTNLQPDFGRRHLGNVHLICSH